MNITASPLAPTSARDLKVDLVCIACDDESPAENPIVLALDPSLGGSLRRAIQDERFRGKPGQLLVLHTQDRLPATRIALLGVGSRAACRPATLLPFAGR